MGREPDRRGVPAVEGGRAPPRGDPRPARPQRGALPLPRPALAPRARRLDARRHARPGCGRARPARLLRGRAQEAGDLDEPQPERRAAVSGGGRRPGPRAAGLREGPYPLRREARRAPEGVRPAAADPPQPVHWRGVPPRAGGRDRGDGERELPRRVLVLRPPPRQGHPGRPRHLDRRHGELRARPHRAVPGLAAGAALSRGDRPAAGGGWRGAGRRRAPPHPRRLRPRLRSSVPHRGGLLRGPRGALLPGYGRLPPRRARGARAPRGHAPTTTTGGAGTRCCAPRRPSTSWTGTSTGSTPTTSKAARRAGSRSSASRTHPWSTTRCTRPWCSWRAPRSRGSRTPSPRSTTLPERVRGGGDPHPRCLRRAPGLGRDLPLHVRARGAAGLGGAAAGPLRPASGPREDGRGRGGRPRLPPAGRPGRAVGAPALVHGGGGPREPAPAGVGVPVLHAGIRPLAPPAPEDAHREASPAARPMRPRRLRQGRSSPRPGSWPGWGATGTRAASSPSRRIAPRPSSASCARRPASLRHLQAEVLNPFAALT